MPNPFDLSDAVIRDLPHVNVTRHAPRGGRPCEYRKAFKSARLGNAAYWVERENEFLLEFALKKLRHTVELSQFVQGGIDEAVVDFVATRDAGVTLQDWLSVRPQYASGDTLKHPFRHAGMFLELLRACLMALEEIHRLGIVHCDIKEDNICLPYAPYPPQRGPLRIGFDRLKLIDFSFSVSAERPLRHPLPIMPQAPYQSGLLKAALACDRAAGTGAKAQQLDWRVDLYSLGYLAGRLLDAGLLQPRGQAGHAALEGARRLVERLRAFDDIGGAELPHAGLIGDIDALLAPLEDVEEYREFRVDGLQEAAPYTPAPFTPMALAATANSPAGGAAVTPIALNGAGLAAGAENAVPTPPIPRLIVPRVPPKPRRAWMLAAALLGVSGLGLGIFWAVPHGYWWSAAGTEASGPALSPPPAPPLPAITLENLATSADGLLAFGVAKRQYRIGDKLEIQYALAKPLYLRLWVVNSSGKVDVLYPEPGKVDRPVAAGKVFSLSGLGIGGPVGQDRLTAVASAEPLPVADVMKSAGQSHPQASATLAYQVLRR